MECCVALLLLLKRRNFAVLLLGRFQAR